ncbi:MAG: response regulator transcription factor [Acidimicrobiales bacterium]
MAVSSTARASTAGRRVLVVEDEPELRELEVFSLELAGLRCEGVGDGKAAIERTAADPPDLVVLDVMLPGVDGREVLRYLRRNTDVPVIFVTALSGTADKLLGFEIGADDYLTKPFNPGELVARVQSVLRRTMDRPREGTGGPGADPDEQGGPAPVAPVAILHETREILVRGQPVPTTRLEFDLLARVASAPRRVFTRAELLDSVWGSNQEWQDPATVTEHVRRLRSKIESDPSQPRHLVTVRGVGYRFEP